MPTEFDTLAPHFSKIVERWPGAQTLVNHYQAVVDSYEGNQHGLVDTVKSFVECVCLTILGEYGVSIAHSDPTMTEMFVEALRLLGLQNTRGASNLDKVLSAHNRLANALNDMRNDTGPISHGRDGFLDPLTQNHVRAYILTADTLLALLMASLDGTEPDLKFTREPYERFNHLHARIDRSVLVDASIEYEGDLPVVVIGVETDGLADGVKLRIEPSRLLYTLDRTAYIEVLGASIARVSPAVPVEGPQAQGVQTAASIRVREGMPSSVILPTYTGYLSPLADDLRQYVSTLDMNEQTNDSSGANMIDSLLGTAEANMGIDWRERELLQARMRIAFRRTLNHFGIPDSVAKISALRLVAWFKTQTASQQNGERGATP